MKLLTLLSGFLFFLNPAFSQSTFSLGSSMQARVNDISIKASFLKVDTTYMCRGDLRRGYWQSGYCFQYNRYGHCMRSVQGYYRWETRSYGTDTQCPAGTEIGSSIWLSYDGLQLANITRVRIDEPTPSFRIIRNSEVSTTELSCANRQLTHLQRAIHTNRQVENLLKSYREVKIKVVDNANTPFNNSSSEIRPSSVEINPNNILSVTAVVASRGRCLLRSSDWIKQEVLKSHQVQNNRR